MRVFLRVQIPSNVGHDPLRDGSLPQVMTKFLETYRPEAAFFITDNGERCAHFYFDLKDVSLMPSLAEPFFTRLGAKVTYCPAMNAEDLKKGIEAVLGRASAVMG